MRRAVLALVVVLVGACSQETVEETTTITAATTTTATVPTSTSTTTTTTTTAPPFSGLLVVIPDDCDGCDDLVEALTDLARGEVLIQVLAALEGDQRPAVQVVALDGTVVREWKGTEATVHPGDRPTAENAQAMIWAACEMLGGCSPDTTSTSTTVPYYLVLHPNDVVCGMEVERRYSLDGEYPPLGVIWGHFWDPAGPSRVLSGVLVDYGRDPQYTDSYYVDFLFSANDTCVTFRFQSGPGWFTHYVLANTGESATSGVLPFGNQSGAQGEPYEVRDMSRDSVFSKFVVGRQYVFEVSLDPRCADPDLDSMNVCIRNFDFVDFLEGRDGVVHAGDGMISVWFAPTGSL